MRTAIYARISKDTAGTGLGVERQEKLCRKLAEGKGWEVVQVFTDNDLSAYAGKPRPGYEAMLAAMEAGNIDAVVCVDQDRLTRHPSELEDFITAADKYGTALANVSGEVDLSTSDGRFRARIMGAVARQESEKKSERIRRQREQAAGNGWWQGGPRRYGYRPARTAEGHPTLVVVPHEAAVIREAVGMILDGVGPRRVAIHLNEFGVPTAKGGVWKSGTVRNLVSNPTIAGLLTHRGEVVGEAAWPGIITRTEREQVLATMGDPRESKGGRPASHLLAGLLTCSKCGAVMQYGRRRNPSGTMAARYGCPSAPTGCAGVAIAAEQTEQAIVEAVKAALDSPSMAETLEGGPAPDVAAVTLRIEEAETALDDLARHRYIDRIISEREYLTARAGLVAQLDELRAQVTPAKPGLRGASFAELWEDADVDTRRAIIGEVIEKVVVLPGQRGRKTIDLDRLQVTWRA